VHSLPHTSLYVSSTYYFVCVLICFIPQATLYVCSMPHAVHMRPHSTNTLVHMDARCWDKGRSMWQFKMTRDGCKDYLPWRGISLCISPFSPLSLARSLSPTNPPTSPSLFRPFFFLSPSRSSHPPTQPIYVSSYYLLLKLLYMCPHTPTYNGLYSSSY
jgi:hypothetical protein